MNGVVKKYKVWLQIERVTKIDQPMLCFSLVTRFLRIFLSFNFICRLQYMTVLHNEYYKSVFIIVIEKQ